MSDSLRALNARMGPVARIASVFAVLGVIVFVFTLRSLGAAFMTPSAKEAKAQVNDQIKKLAADYASGLDGHTKQFNGRSVFFIPSAPVPPPPPPAPVDTSTPPPPPPPPPPSTYGGPKLIAMVNGVAWFEDGKKLTAGDEMKDKLRVKEIIAPWGALVDWDGVEFKISLFDKDLIVYPPLKKVEPKPAANDETKDTASKEPAKETTPPVIKAGDKSPEAEATKPEPPKPEPSNPDSPKPEAPEVPKPDQPKTEKPDSPGSPESQTEKNE